MVQRRTGKAKKGNAPSVKSYHASNRTSVSWYEGSSEGDAFSYDMDQIDPVLLKNIKIINDYIERRENSEMAGAYAHDALVYFGYSAETRLRGMRDAYVRETIGDYIKSCDGMSGLPEWAEVDRVSLGRNIAELTSAIREVIRKLKQDNGSDVDQAMSDVEKKQFLVALESAVIEIQDAPKVNKSNLSGISAWSIKLGREVGAKYLSTELGTMLAVVGKSLSDFVSSLPIGHIRLPW